MNTLITTLLLILAAPAFADAPEYVKNPLAHAEKNPQYYSEGDMNDSGGWEGCSEDEDSTELAPKFTCGGSRTILFHGGEEIVGEFECKFAYRFVSKAKGFLVVMDDCE